MTVVELLVACAMWTLILGLVISSVVTYFRAYREMATRTPNAGSLAHGLDVICQRVRSAQTLVAPDPRLLEAGYRPVWGQNLPLVLAHSTPSGLKLSGFAYDPRRKVVRCLEYTSAFDPQAAYPGQPGEYTILGEAAGLSVWLEREGKAHFLRLRMEDPPLPWETRVRFVHEWPQEAKAP